MYNIDLYSNTLNFRQSKNLNPKITEVIKFTICLKDKFVWYWSVTQIRKGKSKPYYVAFKLEYIMISLMIYTGTCNIFFILNVNYGTQSDICTFEKSLTL